MKWIFLLVWLSSVFGKSNLKVFFDFVDLDHDGGLSVIELQHYVYNMDSDAVQYPSEARILPILQQFDKDLDVKINWEEFHQAFSSLDIASGLDPEQIHLSLTNDPTEMVVMWSSADNKSIPQVQVGTKSGIYTMVFNGTSDYYTVSYPDDIEYVSLSIHTVKLTGLSKSTFYYYQCGSPLTWSAEYNFTTAPDPNILQSEVSWVIYGDMGTVMPLGFEVTQWLVEENRKDPFSLIVHVGDLAYAGTGSDREIEPIWDDWVNQIQPLASVLPYQVTVGNHEHYYNWTAFSHRFTLPWYNRDAYDFWYSFDYGNVHLVAMDMDSASYDIGSDQYNWLEADFAAAYARQQTLPFPSFIILTGHRPFLCSDDSEYDQHSPGAPLLTTLEPLILKYGIDLVVTGHMHCYERTYPTINGTTTVRPGSNNYTNIGEPVYIVQGTAGALIAEKWVYPQPTWSAFRKEEYGFGRMDISTTATSTTLYYSFHGKNGTIVDELWLHKTK